MKLSHSTVALMAAMVSVLPDEVPGCAMAMASRKLEVQGCENER